MVRKNKEHSRKLKPKDSKEKTRKRTKRVLALLSPPAPVASLEEDEQVNELLA